MKKNFVLFLSFVLILQFAGCTNSGKRGDKLQIVTTVFPLYDFARQVAGDKADITLLLPTGTEAHSYEPSMKDVMKIKDCDLFIHLGMGADPWTDSIVNDESFDKNNLLSAMKYSSLKESSHSHGEHSEYEYDAHVWTSLRNSKKIVMAIAEILAKKDSKNADYYKANAEKYCNELESLDKKFSELTKDNDKTIAFADSFPFLYFAEDYNLEYISVFPTCSAEGGPSVSDMKEFIEKIESENISVVFYTETSNGQIPNSVCSKTGAEKLLFHSCHTVNKEQFESGITYLDLMQKNYDALKEAIA